jgi:hypothetical protein
MYVVLPSALLPALQDLGTDALRIAAVKGLGGALIGRALRRGCLQLLNAVWRQRHGEVLLLEEELGEEEEEEEAEEGEVEQAEQEAEEGAEEEEDLAAEEEASGSITL